MILIDDDSFGVGVSYQAIVSIIELHWKALDFLSLWSLTTPQNGKSDLLKSPITFCDIFKLTSICLFA